MGTPQPSPSHPGWPEHAVARRAALKLLGLGTVGLVLAACAEKAEHQGGSLPAAKNTTGDFSARFAVFEPAEEPNGDLSQVVWPAFVIRAGPEVKQLYEFQIQNGELMRYMPCFCGCGSDGHRNNRDCYVKAVNPDGSVAFDSMAPT